MNAERRLPSCLVPIDFSIVGATVEADSNDGDKPMTVLSKLTPSDKTKGARDWFDRLRRANPNLFAHWQLCHGNGRTSGAV